MADTDVLFRRADANELRADIDAAISDGDHARARLMLAQLWQFHRGAAQAGFVTRRWAACSNAGASSALRVTVVRSFTIEPVVPVVRAGAIVAGLELSVGVGDFNTYAQEILDPSSALYGDSAPHVVILAVHTRDIVPELWANASSLDSAGRRAVAERASAELGSLIDVFRSRSDAHLVVHGLELPSTLSLGLADQREELGQAAAIDLVNQNLRSVSDRLPGVYFLDYDALVARVGREAMVDERKWEAMRLPMSPVGVVAVADEWLRHLHPLGGRIAKVLVVDLDNTMWGGVLGEDGLDGLLLGPVGAGAPFDAVQLALLDLRARGVLLAVCSKNLHADAVSALDSLPGMRLSSSDFNAFRINWTDKATNLREIAAELNLGIDSLAFLDDNPAERLAVATQLPDVAVLPVSDDATTLAEAVRTSPLFERLELTNEDRRRSEFYTQERERTAIATAAPDLDSYLESLGTEVLVRIATADELDRVAQLTQKTNQFNLTTRRYSEQRIEHLAASDDWRVYSLRARDRFGDHGLVGVALIECVADTWRVDTLLLSCRVIGRRVETALISVIARDAIAAGVTEVRGEFSPTPKNEPARNFYRGHGFTLVETDGQLHSWLYDLAGGSLAAPAGVAILTEEDT